MANSVPPMIFTRVGSWDLKGAKEESSGNYWLMQTGLIQHLHVQTETSAGTDLTPGGISVDTA